MTQYLVPITSYLFFVFCISYFLLNCIVMKKEIIYKDHRIVYAVEGAGKPVMLVHGFGEDSSVWDSQVTFLKDHFQLILPDLPGTGGSAMVEDMSMEGMADVLKAIADKETREPFTLIGHSMGGYITLAFAEKYADRLNGFGLFHSSAFADSEEKKATRQKGIEFIRQHGAFEFLKTATPNLFSPKTKDERPELIDKQIDSLRNFSPGSLVSYYQAMMARPDRVTILKETALPVLFIIGEHDMAVPMADTLKQCHLPEKSYIHILSGSGHMGMLEETDKSNHALYEYLQAI